MKLFSSYNAFILLAGVQAHFTLDSPISRGFSDDDEPNAPCGGFNTINSTRGALALEGGRYQIDSHHATAKVSVVLSKDGLTFGNSAVQQYTLTGLGTFCANLPVLSDYSAGDNVTMQIVYKASGEPSALYQCADVQLSSHAVTPTSCVNGTGVTASNVVNGKVHLAEASSGAGTSSAASASATPATAAAKSSGAMSIHGSNGPLLGAIALWHAAKAHLFST